MTAQWATLRGTLLPQNKMESQKKCSQGRDKLKCYLILANTGGTMKVPG